jgi:hypothetical protein
MPTTVSLSRLNCTVPGRGPWHLTSDPAARRVIVKNSRSGAKHVVFYGTRTKRTREDAERHATALCAVLNALKARSL